MGVSRRLVALRSPTHESFQATLTFPQSALRLSPTLLLYPSALLALFTSHSERDLNPGMSAKKLSKLNAAAVAELELHKTKSATTIAMLNNQITGLERTCSKQREELHIYNDEYWRLVLRRDKLETDCKDWHDPIHLRQSMTDTRDYAVEVVKSLYPWDMFVQSIKPYNLRELCPHLRTMPQYQQDKLPFNVDHLECLLGVQHELAEGGNDKVHEDLPAEAVVPYCNDIFREALERVTRPGTQQTKMFAFLELADTKRGIKGIKIARKIKFSNQSRPYRRELRNVKRSLGPTFKSVKPTGLYFKVPEKVKVD